MAGNATVGDLLGVAAIEPDGLLVREDGTYVRILEVGVVNPLVLDQAEGERVSAAFGQVAARLPDRQSLQLYVQGTPLALDEILAGGDPPLRAGCRCRRRHRRGRASAGNPPARDRPGAVDPHTRSDGRAA